MRTKLWSVVLAATAVWGISGAVTDRHCTRPGCCPGLPCYQYQYGTSSPPSVAVSLIYVPIDQRPAFVPGVPPAGLTVIPAPVVRDRIKVFQLGQAKIQNDHCFLSRVALTLHESGLWTLSMQADQNPWMTGPRREVSTAVQLPGAVSALTPPIPVGGKESNGLKRNQFVVRVRCYGSYPIMDVAPGVAPGKPVLFELPTAYFWVQRGIPYDFWAQQTLPQVSQFFDLVDRVEVEFSYR